MPDRTLPVLKAMVAALKGDAGVAAIVGDRVYDRAPQSVTFPMVSLGPTYAQPAIETIGGEGWEVSVTLDLWTRGGGRAVAASLMAAAVDALHNADIALDAGTTVLCRLESQHVMMEQDGVTHHGIQRWRVLTDG